MKRLAVALLLSLATFCFVVPVIGDAPEGTAAAPVIAGKVRSTFQPNSGKIFIAVIGNDAREGNPDSARADALHIVGINTETMKGGILNFPRDSWVNIPGWGTSKMNESLVAGGPERVVQTMEHLTGIKIDYWMMTGFDGFRELVRGIEGVRINVPINVYDPSGSGANLKKGVQRMMSETALSYVRTRHSFPNGDIDRSTNQAKFMLAVLRKLGRQTADNPANLLDWISLGRKHTRLDIPASEMFRLGVLATQVQPKDIGNVTVPVTLGSAGAASVVFISPSAEQIYRRFAANGSL